MAKKAKRNWLVEVECTIRKSIAVENCTEQEARRNPWEHAVDETELGMPDWNVKSVTPNE